MPSLITDGSLPFLVLASLLLPGCPLTDDYYIGKGDAVDVQPSGGNGGSPDTSSSGGGSASGVAGAPGSAGAGNRAGAGGDIVLGTDGCVSLTNQEHEYRFCFSPLSQANARAKCGGWGMTLAVIEDQAESDWIAETFSGQYQGATPRAFIGANDVANEGEWRWADGNTFWRSGAPIIGQYANWAGGEPNDESLTAGAADCLTIFFADGTWADLSCDAELSYVCETR